MSKLTQREKKSVVRNIKLYKKRLYPERGGGNRLANELGISPQLLSQWVKGTRTPTLEKLIVLADVFNISIQELCGQPNPPAHDNAINVHDAIIMLSNNIKKRPRKKGLCRDEKS